MLTKDELIASLGKYEWKDVEFKKAQRGVSDSAYETVSAFSNTAGGYLVFGVKDTDGQLDVVGVIEVDKVQNDFLSCLRTGDKLNRVISSREDAIDFEDKTLLIFYIQESPRNEKPIYLNGDIRKSFIRRGGGDERCTNIEIERLLRDASGATFDGQLMDGFDVEEIFDPSSVAWYRRLFQEREDARNAELTDIEFLNEWGFIHETGNVLKPTRAAILLFGTGRYLRQILPRAVVDYQRIDLPFSEWSTVERWHDRVVVEENIIKAWQLLVEKYYRYADSPFSVDESTLRRHDDPPDYISFREAVINLLIHQDYGDYTRKPVIKIFTDQTIFWNPGDAFATVEQLLEPSEKEVRNPAIVNAFRRIGLSDQAGTGIRSILRNWRQMGYVPATINNNKTEKTFEVLLDKEELMTEEQYLFQAQLGVHLSDNEAAVLAFTCRKNVITMTDAKSVTNKNTVETQDILNRLVLQRLLEPMESGTSWGLADHLKEGTNINDQPGAQPHEVSGNLVTDQPAQTLLKSVTPKLTKLNEQQKQIIQLCEFPRMQTELMKELGFTHRSFFRRRHLKPLIEANLIEMTFPDEPNHPQQAYVVTEVGVTLLARYQAEAEKEK